VRRFDQHGLVLQRGRIRVRPFGRIGTWPERQAQVAILADAEDAAVQRRLAYRAEERRAMGGVCDECGGKLPNRHQAACRRSLRFRP
jgi:hypothetical protein